MIRKRLGRLAAVVSSALLALMLVGSGIAVAKTPGWTMSVTLIPGTVSPGGYAAFQVTITNGGKSNIAKLALTDSRTETPYSVTPSTGCAAGGQLDCALGALGSGQSTTRVIVYKTPSSGTTFPVTFEANTSGVTFSDKGTSHGDTLRSTVSTALNGSPDFAGGYAINGDPFTTGGGNQSTTVIPPTTGIGVTVEDISGPTDPCASETPIGQLTVLHVAGGAHFSTPFETTMTIATSALPDELVLSQVKLCHLYDNGSAVPLPRCSTDAAPTNGVACFWPKWGGSASNEHESHDAVGGDADDWTSLVLDMWDYQNGSIRGGF